ncbi:2-hydroxyacid dehydrogenase [Rossellomorea vietnamensis]|uniref:2-hydroxyacid dehydrogenase n=1 Tax=Rossellomorea vietnamensis TaxID=218284 RepID=UPI001E514AFB|nr:D-glycerate dehydrogenase [Rossellomorea vietnamensis]MCC5801922.1 D-glycerate dehydrogenase [Rossellomorea vietnamensis]
MKPFIYITRKLPEAVVAPLTKEFEVEMWEREDAPVPRDILLEKAEKASALLTMLSDKVDRELLQGASYLKVVANLAVGFDNIDLEAAKEKGVIITNTPGVLTETTADLTFALLMATARRIVEADRYIKEGKWKSWSPLLLAGMDIHHKTMGIVGMGSIGEAVARRANGFNMEVLYHNRSRKSEAEETLGVRYVSFDDLLAQSDFVVVLAPLNEETQGMFQEDQFTKMKETAIFINAARGAIVNEVALEHALKRGDIAGAGLDVFETEPINEDHPLLQLDQVVAIPHIGSSSKETRHDMMTLCVENILAVLKGDNPKTAVK